MQMDHLSSSRHYFFFFVFIAIDCEMNARFAIELQNCIFFAFRSIGKFENCMWFWSVISCFVQFKKNWKCVFFLWRNTFSITILFQWQSMHFAANARFHTIPVCIRTRSCHTMSNVNRVCLLSRKNNMQKKSGEKIQRTRWKQNHSATLMAERESVCISYSANLDHFTTIRIGNFTETRNLFIFIATNCAIHQVFARTCRGCFSRSTCNL